ncbi:MAG TPA: acetate/propionate family kinase [Gaiellaceae bacterium]
MERDGSTTKVEALAGAGGVSGSEPLTQSPIEAVAHRVVHGGRRFGVATLVDDDVLEQIRALSDLAPLHNGPALEAIGDARRSLPDVPHVAVFDTAFHRTIPPEAAAYAVPRRWREEWEVRRYGFHGLSVQWAAERVPVERLVVCHLGGGCSVSAVRGGKSVETTMGFSPLEGVPMATRSGSIDAEVVLYLLRHGFLSPEEVEQALEHESGLLGLSGISDRVEELEASPEPAARLALEVFAYRVAAAVGAMAVALEGLDALVFTAGVGERSALVRDLVCGRLGFLGVQLDPAANAAARPDADVAAPGSPVRIVVLEAREDVVAARAARELLALPPQRQPEAFADAR